MAAKHPKSPKKDFSNEWKGNHSAIHQAGTFVARTQAEWHQLWTDTHGHYGQVPKTPQLPKDKMAIGIFTGQASSPSNINVTGITQENGKTVIAWNAQRPPASGPGQMVATVMHDPFLLKFVDKTDTAVEFRKQSPATPSINLKDLKPKN